MDQQRFCGNSRLCVTPTAHCLSMKSFSPWQWPVAPGGVTVPERVALGKVPPPAGPLSALLQPCGCCPCRAEPREKQQHKLNPARAASQEWHEFVEFGQCQGQNRGCGDTEAFGAARGAPAARLAPRGPGGELLLLCSTKPAASALPELEPAGTGPGGAERQKPGLCLHKALPRPALSHWPQGEEQKTPNFTRQKGPLTPKPTQQLHSNNH